MRMTDAVDGVDHARCTDQRVAPPRHRGRPGMSLLAGDGDFIPSLALRAGHDTNRQAGRFEDRPLLDMHFEISRDRVSAYRLWAGKADPLELGAERHTS